jgi:hypothetical protein
MRSTVFWLVTSCSSEIFRRSGGRCCLHIHCGWVSQAWSRKNHATKWRRRRYVPSKLLTLHEIHFFTTQKIALFIVIALRTSNPKSTTIRVVTSPRWWSQRGYPRCRQYPPPPFQKGNRVHGSNETPWRYRALAQGLKSCVVLCSSATALLQVHSDWHGSVA